MREYGGRADYGGELGIDQHLPAHNHKRAVLLGIASRLVHAIKFPAPSLAFARRLMFQSLIFQHIGRLGIETLRGARLIRSRSRAWIAARVRCRKNSRSTSSMKADRDCFDPAIRSIAANRSPESVIDVFSFILPLYYSKYERRSYPKSQIAEVAPFFRALCGSVGSRGGRQPRGRTLLSAAFDFALGPTFAQQPYETRSSRHPGAKRRIYALCQYSQAIGAPPCNHTWDRSRRCQQRSPRCEVGPQHSDRKSKTTNNKGCPILPRSLRKSGTRGRQCRADAPVRRL